LKKKKKKEKKPARGERGFVAGRHGGAGNGVFGDVIGYDCARGN